MSINNKDQASIVGESKRLNRSGKIWLNNGVIGQQASIRDGILEIQSDKITHFSDSDENYVPQVSINDNGDVVAVFAKTGSNNDLYYRVGKLSDDSLYIIRIGGVTKYTEGSFPSVSMNNKGDVVEIHQSGKNLFCKVGVLDERKINWDAAVKFDTGNQPNVSINNKNQIIEVHQKE